LSPEPQIVIDAQMIGNFAKEGGESKKKEVKKISKNKEKIANLDEKDFSNDEKIENNGDEKNKETQ
jgi:hypothetical protein